VPAFIKSSPNHRVRVRVARHQRDTRVIKDTVTAADELLLEVIGVAYTTYGNYNFYH
jgi:hypothetical protein